MTRKNAQNFLFLFLIFIFYFFFKIYIWTSRFPDYIYLFIVFDFNFFNVYSHLKFNFSALREYCFIYFTYYFVAHCKKNKITLFH